jgi:hypothetical protein
MPAISQFGDQLVLPLQPHFALTDVPLGFLKMSQYLARIERVQSHETQTACKDECSALVEVSLRLGGGFQSRIELTGMRGSVFAEPCGSS